MISEKITVAIIEDEYPAARLLRGMISDLRPDWQIEVLPGSIDEAVKWFATHAHPDIVFLDIQLTDGNSFHFIEQAHPQSVIVFTTAYDDYAVRAFSVNSIDYLLKPIHKERLEATFEKIARFMGQKEYENNQEQYLKEVFSSLLKKEKRYRSRFLISLNGRLTSLKVNEVAYFFSENKLTYAVTATKERFIVDFPLNRLEDELDPDVFFRVNRQFILSVDAIKKIEPYFNNKYTVHVNPDYDGIITVSRDRVSALKEWLNY